MSNEDNEIGMMTCPLCHPDFRSSPFKSFRTRFSEIFWEHLRKEHRTTELNIERIANRGRYYSLDLEIREGGKEKRT